MMVKLGMAAHAQVAGIFASTLGHADSQARIYALDALRAFDPAALTPHTGAIAGLLEDPVADVRYEALVALDQLESAALAQHAPAIARRLADSDFRVRMLALAALRELQLAAHARAASAAEALARAGWATLIGTSDLIPKFFSFLGKDQKEKRLLVPLSGECVHKVPRR